MLDPGRSTGGYFGGMAVSDAAHSPLSSPNARTINTNATNVWGDGLPYSGGNTKGPNGQTAAVDALWGLMNTYDTLKNMQGWLSLDGGVRFQEADCSGRNSAHRWMTAATAKMVLSLMEAIRLSEDLRSRSRFCMRWFSTASCGPSSQASKLLQV